MAKIETAEAAQRLSHALLSDIRLYNEEAIKSGEDMREAVDEARALFRDRVIEAHHAVFEAAVAASELAPLVTGTTRRAATDSSGFGAPSAELHASASDGSADGNNMGWMAFGFFGLLAVIGYVLLR